MPTQWPLVIAYAGPLGGRRRRGRGARRADPVGPADAAERPVLTVGVGERWAARPVDRPGGWSSWSWSRRRSCSSPAPAVAAGGTVDDGTVVSGLGGRGRTRWSPARSSSPAPGDRPAVRRLRVAPTTASTAPTATTTRRRVRTPVRVACGGRPSRSGERVQHQADVGSERVQDRARAPAGDVLGDLGPASSGVPLTPCSCWTISSGTSFGWPPPPARGSPASVSTWPISSSSVLRHPRRLHDVRLLAEVLGDHQAGHVERGRGGRSSHAAHDELRAVDVVDRRPACRRPRPSAASASAL